MKQRVNKIGIFQQIREMYGVAGDTDSYKFSHHPQYPKDGTNMQSYISSRGGEYDLLCWAGLQLIIKDNFFQQLTYNQIENLVNFGREHFVADYMKEIECAFKVVANEHKGWLPLRICAIPEGMMVPPHIALATIELTVDDHRLLSLPSYFEALIQRVWDTTTVATKSWHMRQTIYAALLKSSVDPDAEINFKLHDFGSRGTGAPQEAAYAGLGHLIPFRGSDTTIAIMAANLAYSCPMSGFNIPASEHSTTTAHGRGNEIALVEQMFEAYANPGKLFATVIDSEDWVRFIREIAPRFKDKLNNSGATWVFRPDSGDPVETPLQVVRELANVFGYTVNKKGYKVLNNVRCIQGDGITKVELALILDKLLDEKWSATNMVFGMGGGLLRKHDRDTLKFSMKCCAIKRNGYWFDVYKDPSVYDAEWNKLDVASFKKSKAGHLITIYRDHDKSWLTIRDDEMSNYIHEGYRNIMEVVYEDGVLLRDMTLDAVRSNAGCA